MVNTFSPILIYHATYTQRPDDMKDRLHDVHPDTMLEQVLWLKEHYDIVTVDAWFKAKSKAGLACITFDDAYDCTFSEALPRLLEHNIPSTVFLNGSTFGGEIFWRDKIRLLINGGHVEKFLEFAQETQGSTLGLNSSQFYRLTKAPQNNSKRIAEVISRFLAHTGLDRKLINHCAQSTKALTDHPLVTYGNHTVNHYVLASITESEQQYEIVHNQKLLETMPIRRSNIFAIPFGGTDTVNVATGKAVKKAGHSGALYCHSRLNRVSECLTLGPVPAADRLLAPPSLHSLQGIFQTQTD